MESIYGIEEDLKTLKHQNKDGFEQILIQVIKDYLGIEFCKYIKITFGKKKEIISA